MKKLTVFEPLNKQERNPKAIRIGKSSISIGSKAIIKIGANTDVKAKLAVDEDNGIWIGIDKTEGYTLSRSRDDDNKLVFSHCSPHLKKIPRGIYTISGEQLKQNGVDFWLLKFRSAS